MSDIIIHNAVRRCKMPAVYHTFKSSAVRQSFFVPGGDDVEGKIYKLINKKEDMNHL